MYKREREKEKNGFGNWSDAMQLDESLEKEKSPIKGRHEFPHDFSSGCARKIDFGNLYSTSSAINHAARVEITDWVSERERGKKKSFMGRCRNFPEISSMTRNEVSFENRRRSRSRLSKMLKRDLISYSLQMHTRRISCVALRKEWSMFAFNFQRWKNSRILMSKLIPLDTFSRVMNEWVCV